MISKLTDTKPQSILTKQKKTNWRQEDKRCPNAGVSSFTDVVARAPPEEGASR